MAKKSRKSSTGKGGGRKRASKKSGRRSAKRSGKNGLRLKPIAAAAAGVIAAVLIVWLGSRLYKPVVPPGAEFKEVKVFVAASDGKLLRPVTYDIEPGTIEARIAEALGILLKDKSRTIPEGTSLRRVEVKGGTAFIDLSDRVTEVHTGGSSGEILTIYSIVNTVTLNFRQIKDVQILINGKKAKTLAGHIDISFPIPPEKQFIQG